MTIEQETAIAFEAQSIAGYRRALATHGFDECDYQQLADQIGVSLVPASYLFRRDRLSLLWMQKHKASQDAPSKTTAWLSESCRLLEDIPQDILAFACDHVAMTCKFLPDVADIRAVAEPLLNRRKLCYRKLLALLYPPREKRPARAQTKRCTADQAVAIIKELGLRSGTPVQSARTRGKPRWPTRDDYIAMGVVEDILDRMKIGSSKRRAA